MTPNSRSYLNHFTQPDSIVPDPYNSLDYDRYAYARYNPVNNTDPSGHAVCDENGNCREGNKQLTQRIHAEDWKRTNNRPWSRYKIKDDRILSEGTVYHTQGLVPGGELNNIQLSNKAVPPGLSGVTPEINILNTPWWHTAGDMAGAWSDMQLDVEFYPINTKINWQFRESGLWITDIEVTNSVPDIVNWVDINFSAPMQNDTIPVQEYVQANDSLSVDVNFQPYKNIETKMDIRLVADGSFPPNAFVSINMSPGGLPPSGCSILP